jgi:hypothetical protein
MAGLFALLEALTSGFGQVIVPGMLVVSSDAAATAANLLAHGLLFRFAILAALIGAAFHVAWTLLMYELFKPVSRSLSLLAAFFGLGYLIVRSTFMPRILGMLEAVAGLCWLTFLWVPLAHHLSPYNQAVAGFGEIALMLWLLVKGVKVHRWNETAAAATK